VPVYFEAPLWQKFNTSTTPVLFEIVSVFIYSLTEYLVKIAPCYFCQEHTTALTLLDKLIEFVSSEFVEAQSNCITAKRTHSTFQI